MKILKRFVARLSSFTTRHQDDQRLKEEIAEHVALQTAENLRAGLSPAQARRQALLKFGAVESMTEDYRSERRFLSFDTLLQDLRFALRMLRKSPGFTLVAVLTLALGIGVNTAIFSVIDAVLLRPLPYPNPGGLISVQEAGRGVGNSVSYPDFFDWQAQNHVFSSMASYHADEFTLAGVEEPTHVLALFTSADLFKVLQVSPLLGRTFQPEDDQRGHDVAILSYSLWHGVFHASPDIVGRSISLNNERFTVIGVMPEGFQFPPTSHRDLWVSTAIDRESRSNIMTGRGYNILNVIARLRDGTSLASAQTEMNLIARRLAQQYPKNNAKRTTVKMVPEIERIVGSVRASLFLILGAVIGVLLIACVNLANLSLARNLVREKEIAVRAAVGASRSRLFRQLFTESILLSLLGGAAGIALAAWGTQELVRFAPQDLPRITQVGLDWPVLAFASLLSIGTAIVFGSVPAFRASKTNSAVSLKDAGQTSSQGISQLRLRSGLVIAETALAMLLLIAAGLLVSSYKRLVSAPLGFTPAGLLTFTFDLPSPPYTTPQTVNFINELLPRLRALPGATAVAADWSLPFSGTGVSTGLSFEGRTFAPGNTPMSVVDAITPDYFQTMGIPLLKGRLFTDADNSASRPVVIINDAFAQRYFPNENPVGKRIQPSFSVTNDYPWREIVAVVGNTKMGDLSEDFQPEFYMPFAQIPNYNAFVLKVQGDPLTLVSAVRATVASLDKNLPLYGIQTMDGYLASSVAARRFLTLLLGLFATLALVLATVGIYGVMAFSVSRRTRELGIRMALGADKASVMQLVLWQGARLALVGVAIGIAAALALTRVVANFLFEIRATDPVTYAAVAFLLVVVALFACYIPARRAMKVDPLAALRHE
ncbi:MAG TPA: ABC transporter permease [Candidatus Acidoferrales bacterium]|nr:ABC transporter permease [Candidatus Acidoferrales bacterium]